MKSFIKQLAAQRKKFLDGLDAIQGDINLDIFEDFYPDRAHFIYELLQNAEDAGATKATFTLSEGGCSFEHDGRPFTEEDVRNITGIHNSSKSARPDQIGQFGVGFKSVFVYTLTPEVRSSAAVFRISRLVMPEWIDGAPSRGNRTRFDLPFNNPKKPVGEAYSEIEAGLNSLAETTLLFLSSLRSICWQIDDRVSGEVERMPRSKNHFEVRKSINGQAAAGSHFLRFDAPVNGLTKKRLAIAFQLDFLPKVRSFNRKKPLFEQMRIVPANPGRVAVYFPAEKETSGLRFHLHAPFVPDLSRSSVKDTAENEPLFRQLAELAAASLRKIRKLGLSNADFLAVLPNPHDLPKNPYKSIDDAYECIRKAIVDTMNNQPLTPTYSGKHAPANRLLQARGSLKELLTDKDIAFLAGGTAEAKRPLKWAIGVTQKNSRIDRFLEGLDIRNWDVAKFVERVRDCTVDGRSSCQTAAFDEWLRKKPLGWHQQLYALLDDHLSRREYPQLNYLKACKIVRCSDKAYRMGNSCFFPADGIEHDEEMPRVARAVYTSGKDKKQQDAARSFLQKIDVRPVDETVQVEAILKRRYGSDAFDPREQDLERFVALVEREPHRAMMFAEYFIFEGADGLWRQPRQVFLNKPFLDTGLSSSFAVFASTAGASMTPGGG